MKLFGTDGIRGRANTAPMTPDMMMQVAMAAGHVFQNGEHRHTVVIGKDTRLSCYMIEQALGAGFISMGMNVIFVGVLPTPAISMLTRSMRADLGVMISASHNPYHDNGIKFFGPDGYKLDTEKEVEIEEKVFSKKYEYATPDTIGKAIYLEGSAGRYIEFVKNSVASHIRFDGLKIVIDCAHGAAYRVAPKVLWELGAEVISIGISPDGLNINRGVGAVSTKTLCETVLEHEADIGIALDGDADRIIACDERGQLIDGDQIMALIATNMHKKGTLKGGAVVGTVMSNIGIAKYLKSLDLTLVRTSVGDRAVGEYMRTNQCNIGGEQSGHVILSDVARTGDGLVAGLQILSALVDAKRENSALKASHICRVFEKMPQRLVSFLFKNGDPMDSKIITDTIAGLEEEIDGKGRILVRKSGTEPLIRLMVEHEDEKQMAPILQKIADALVSESFIDPVKI